MSNVNIPNGIAVIGIDCRFPGAVNADKFWQNLKNGVESISNFSDQDLGEYGIDPSLYNQPDYVKKGFIIDNEDLFDASFFGYSPREAENMDPQHRLFLETVWNVLEDGGYPPGEYEGPIGIFAGSKISTYLLNLINGQQSMFGAVSDYQTLIGNDKDYLVTRVSYKLNLKGPSVTVQCACSTSLVAVHFACENLLSGTCDMALAGGVAILVPQKTGYLYQEGMMLSPDGHCRAFDAKAKGMAPGNGVGVVLLKRLEDALEDNDHIYAVIRGTAVNNDGSLKTGYTTPSVDGQAKVIKEAVAIAGVKCESLSYIETHGTGTELGDPIEIEAINEVFGSETSKTGFCAIGSVKSNIGHLDTAAGIAGLIKTVLSLKHGYLLPSLNYEKPNPKIDFDNSPFYVNTQLLPWKTNGCPRRAGVSSFGFGGTNAHVILEQAPERSFEPLKSSPPLHLLTLSAKTEKSLKQQIQNYHIFLDENRDAAIGDICFTANTGRSHFQYRFAAIAESIEDLRLQLSLATERKKASTLFEGVADNRIEPAVAFDLSNRFLEYEQLTDIGSDSHVLQTHYNLPLSWADKKDYLLILSALGKLFIQGAKIDWESFYQDVKPRRVSLPTYPFERKRYWFCSPSNKDCSSVMQQTGTGLESIENHFYEIIWQEKEDAEKVDIFASGKPGTWIIFADKGGIGELLAEKLRLCGNKCVFVFADNREIHGDLSHVFDSFDFLNKKSYINLFEEIQKSNLPPCCGIIHLWGLNSASYATITTELLKNLQDLFCGSIFHLMQSINSLKWTENPPRLCLVTQGAQPVSQESKPISVTQAPLWGLGKVIAIENPELNCLRVDLDPLDAKNDIPYLLNELYSIAPESQVAFRGKRRYVPRLSRVKSGSINRRDSSEKLFHHDGTYLITGGLGALGIEITRWMADNNAGHIVLVSRRKPTEQTISKLKVLEQKGTEISVFSADVTNKKQLKDMFETIKNELPPLKGIIHAAGILDRGATLENEKYDTFLKVTAPKIQGAWNLHELGDSSHLDFFICFSSVVSLWGSHGMASYTAANSFLDALSYYRNSTGFNSKTINWGPWSEIGVVAEHHMEERLAMQGIGTINPGQGVAFLEKTIQSDIKQIGIVSADWNKIAGQFQNKIETKFLHKLIERTFLQNSELAESDRNSDSFVQLQKASFLGRRKLLQYYLKEHISKLMRIPENHICEDTDLIQIGMDSLIFLSLAQTINNDLRIRVVPHELFENPTIAALSNQFAKKINFEAPDDINSENHTTFLVESDPENRYAPFGLTDIQHAYWIGRSGVTELGDVACHVYFEIATEQLDLDRYTVAWQRVIDRHDMLRAIILPDGHQQILENIAPFQIHITDLRDEPSDAITQKTALIREEMSHQVRPADQWPLFEVRATLLDTSQTLLHISIDILIADGYSIYNLMQEVFHYYQTPELTIPSMACTFRDYVLAEAKFRESELYHQSRQYWLDGLSSLPPSPELPLAKTPSELKKTRFVRREKRLDANTWAELQKCASQAGLTRANILLAAYAEVLATWSKSQKFTLNLTFFHRLQGHPQINEVIGDFTSLILLKVDSTLNVPFKERALRIQTQLWKDMEYRYFSGVRVLQELSRKNQGSERTLMPVVFTSNLGYENIRQESTGLSLPGKMVYSISQTPQVWIDNQISEENNELVIVWDAVEELFPDKMLDDMFKTYCRLLEMLAHDETVLDKYDFALIPEYQYLSRGKTESEVKSESTEMLHSLFFSQAGLTPDNTAIISSGKSLSYKELSYLSLQIGRQLKKNGAMPNTLIAVVMEKGWEQIAAVLGILNSGAAYLPIDAAVPKERLWHLLEDGQVRLILTQSRLEKKLEWPDDVICISVDTFESINQNSEETSNLVQNCSDLAYVIHTSGSTGVPKGVMIDHKGAVNTITDINKRFNINGRDSVLALSALNFDLSVYDIFGTLGVGGTIIIPDASGTKDPGHWLTLIKQNKVTVWNSVPALMQMLVEYLAGRKESAPDSLRLILLSGDWIPLDLPDRIKSICPQVEIISLGGATEASIWSILYPINAVDPQWKSIPYGRPMVNQNFHVLNENMENCPDWVTGDLYISGIGLAKGYWHDEVKTGNAFIHHARTGERLYQTGDLGRYLPDGNIEFLGREDQQVKINGYRIELGEIEATLKRIDGILESVVVTITDSHGNKHLAVHVIADKKHTYSDNQLKENLRWTLPEYMIPSFYFFCDSFPVTANGKIDRKKLADPDKVSFEKTDAEYIAPATETEQIIFTIFKEIVGIEKISVKSLFFDIGATSMHLVRLQNRLNAIFEKDISIVDIFSYPTISSLAQFINQKAQDSASIERADQRGEKRIRSQRRRYGKDNKNMA